MKNADVRYEILIEDILSGETILGGIYSDLLKASDNITIIADNELAYDYILNIDAKGFLTCYDDYKKIYIEEIGG